MSLSDIATIIVTSSGSGVNRAGFGVPLILSHSATWTERSRSYNGIGSVATDWAVNTPEYIAANQIFEQNPSITTIMIGRAALQPQQTFSIGLGSNSPSVGKSYKLRLAGATGVIFPSQDANYVAAGPTPWSPSGVWARGAAIVNLGNIYSCVSQGASSFGGASGPTGTNADIVENQIHWMYAGTGSTGITTNDAIMNGLKVALESLASPTLVATNISSLLGATLTGSALARTIQLQANSPATFFGIQAYNRGQLSTTQTHADPGVATDLTAINNEQPNWYGLVTLYNSSALIAAAAAWVESNTKLYAAASLDTTIPGVAETPAASDIAHVLKGHAYARSWVFFHPSNDEFADAAEEGRFFPFSPGSETWRAKALTGVTEQTYTPTELTNMKAKYVHFYYDMGGKPIVGGDAKMAANDYVDVVRFRDWYMANLQADLADIVIEAEAKVPFTNPGIDSVASAVEKRNEDGIRAGGIAANPRPIVTAPDVTDISSSDKQSRELSGIQTSWVLAGAIHHITVNVFASA